MQQFVMMIYHGSSPLPGSDAWQALPAEEQKRVYQDYGALNNTAGVTPGVPMGLPKDAKTVRVSNGQAQIAEGSYREAGEAVGGYLVFEAEDLEAALKLAAGIPAARLGGAVEVRPVAKYW
jgi:hypothetical protein